MSPSAEKDVSALDRRCSQCGHPFRDHKAHLDPTERGGFRASMTCPIPPGHHPRCTGQHETIMGETACVLPPEGT